MCELLCRLFFPSFALRHREAHQDHRHADHLHDAERLLPYHQGQQQREDGNDVVVDRPSSGAQTAHTVVEKHVGHCGAEDSEECQIEQHVGREGEQRKLVVVRQQHQRQEINQPDEILVAGDGHRMVMVQNLDQNQRVDNRNNNSASQKRNTYWVGAEGEIVVERHQRDTCQRKQHTKDGLETQPFLVDQRHSKGNEQRDGGDDNRRQTARHELHTGRLTDAVEKRFGEGQQQEVAQMTFLDALQLVGQRQEGNGEQRGDEHAEGEDNVRRDGRFADEKVFGEDERGTPEGGRNYQEQLRKIFFHVGTSLSGFFMYLCKNFCKSTKIRPFDKIKNETHWNFVRYTWDDT